MLPRTCSAYLEEGFRVHFGTPRNRSSGLSDNQSGIRLISGGGLAVTDGFLFVVAAGMLRCRSAFIIGNASGISTFVIAELFPSAIIDVIDAEIEGHDNALGTAISRRIASRRFPNVQITVGWSPQDLPAAMRANSYDLAFIDGLHTDEQVAKDFFGLLPVLSERSVVILHDIAGSALASGWETIRRGAAENDFRAFDATFTQFGSGILSRGNQEFEQWLEVACESFANIDPVTYGVRKGIWGILDHSPRSLGALAYSKLVVLSRGLRRRINRSLKNGNDVAHAGS